MINSPLYPVTESYFGRSKELEEIASLLQDICDQYKKYDAIWDTTSKAKLSSKLTESEEMKKINKLFEKQFGFAEVKVTIMNWMYQPNAFAMPTGFIECISETPMPIAPDKTKGWYDSYHNHVCAICIWDQMFKLGFTGPEMLAVILHEIGHNFQSTALTDYERICDFIYSIAGVVHGGKHAPQWFLHLIMSQWGNQIASIAEPTISAVQGLVPQPILSAIDIFNGIVLKLMDLCPITFQQARSLVNLAVIVIKAGGIIPHVIFNSLFGFSGEEFADSFATAYGYGPEMTSGLGKLSTNTNFRTLNDSSVSFAFSKYNPLHVVNEIIILPFIFFMHLLDEHPVPEARMLAQIENLERELNKNTVLTAKQKAACKADLQRTKAAYKQYQEMDPDMRHLTVVATYRTFVGKFGANIDFRHGLNQLFNKALGSRTYA